jgi:hypothetical protein
VYKQDQKTQQAEKAYPGIKDEGSENNDTTSTHTHAYPGNTTWRKQKNATNTMIYQFTGDGQNNFTS